MAYDRNGLVAVGVDGSTSGLAAVELGAYEAALRGHTLVLVRAISWPMIDVPLGPQTGVIEHAERESAKTDIEQAVARALVVAPRLEIRARIELGSPADLLLNDGDARLIVVGATRRASAATSLLGSTATQVATHADCPVLVARGHERPGGDVVVGIDGGRSSESALAFAFEEAELRGSGLTALHAWNHPMALGPADILAFLDSDRRRAETGVLDEALAGWPEKHPGVRINRLVSRSHAKAALADASCRAQLVVVGARGRGGFAGLLLGSVGLSLLRAAACPVAVIRPARA